MAREIAIDLGTANTLIYARGKGIIMREPSVVAVNTKTDQACSVGKEAKEIIGRTPGSIIAVRPLKDGVIADFDIAATMLQELIKKSLKGTAFTKARVIICIPSGVTAVERRAVREAAEKAGAENSCTPRRANRCASRRASFRRRFLSPLFSDSVPRPTG